MRVVQAFRKVFGNKRVGMGDSWMDRTWDSLMCPDKSQVYPGCSKKKIIMG